MAPGGPLPFFGQGELYGAPLSDRLCNTHEEVFLFLRFLLVLSCLRQAAEDMTTVFRIDMVLMCSTVNGRVGRTSRSAFPAQHIVFSRRRRKGTPATTVVTIVRVETCVRQ